MELNEHLASAKRGDLAAFEHLVAATEGMVYAVVRRILRNPHDATDAVQETYTCAFTRLNELREADAFPGWLRRIAINSACRLRRSQRNEFLAYGEAPDVPVLDEEETEWCQEQRGAMAAAIVALAPDDRLLCERFYHGGWSITRLAEDGGVTEPAMRKRLQRIRDQLRKEIEMSEQKMVVGEKQPEPKKIIELLAKPRLTQLPDNPVGRIWRMVRSYFPDAVETELPEVIEDKQVLEAFGDLNIRSHLSECGQWIHRIDEGRFLRSEMTVPMLLSNRGKAGPQSLISAGKVYRVAATGPRHLEAFHQCECLLVRENSSHWQVMDILMRMAKDLFPGMTVTLEETNFPFCDQTWAMTLNFHGQSYEILAWGSYKSSIVKWLGNDPGRVAAIGVGMGLDRMACAHFGIDDIRKLEAMRMDK